MIIPRWLCLLEISKFFVIISVLSMNMCRRHQMFAWDREKRHHSSPRYQRISASRVMLLLYFRLCCMRLSAFGVSWINRRYHYNASLYIFHLSLSHRACREDFINVWFLRKLFISGFSFLEVSLLFFYNVAAFSKTICRCESSLVTRSIVSLRSADESILSRLIW